MNLVKKAKGEYRNQILELFTRSDIPFSIDAEWCNYAYLNRIIDAETATDAKGRKTEICRFANPFIQRRLYNAFILDLIGDSSPILPLEPLDSLTDVFEDAKLDLPALLERYKGYLDRMNAANRNPWKEQPRRTDRPPPDPSRRPFSPLLLAETGCGRFLHHQPGISHLLME